MNNLRFAPCVGVVNDCYEIIAVVSCEGRCFVTVGREQYYEDSTGTCRIHTPVHKIRIPQKALDLSRYRFAVCYIPFNFRMNIRWLSARIRKKSSAERRLR